MNRTNFPNKELEYNFHKRNINILWFQTFERAKEYLLDCIPKGATIGIGHSKTLESIGITEALQKRGNQVYDKELGSTPEEMTLLKKNALLADYYISGSNAISMDGRIVNIDHSGNRVAALAFGPEKVFIVVGINKITDTLVEAINRAKNIASPQNAIRAGYTPPCVTTGYCVDCLSPERVCNTMSIIEGQHIKGRMTILIVNDEAGF